MDHTIKPDHAEPLLDDTYGPDRALDSLIFENAKFLKPAEKTQERNTKKLPPLLQMTVVYFDRRAMGTVLPLFYFLFIITLFPPGSKCGALRLGVHFILLYFIRNSLLTPKIIFLF